MPREQRVRPEKGAAAKDTLNVGISAEPATLDPHLQSGQATRLIKQQIYRGLMTYTADSSIETDVADSYTVSDDGLTYTFLLKDATFRRFPGNRRGCEIFD